MYHTIAHVRADGVLLVHVRVCRSTRMNRTSKVLLNEVGCIPPEHDRTRRLHNTVHARDSTHPISPSRPSRHAAVMAEKVRTTTESRRNLIGRLQFQSHVDASNGDDTGLQLHMRTTHHVDVAMVHAAGGRSRLCGAVYRCVPRRSRIGRSLDRSVVPVLPLTRVHFVSGPLLYACV
jgi:hypothetical protein